MLRRSPLFSSVPCAAFTARPDFSTVQAELFFSTSSVVFARHKHDFFRFLQLRRKLEQLVQIEFAFEGGQLFVLRIRFFAGVFVADLHDHLPDESFIRFPDRAHDEVGGSGQRGQDGDAYHYGPHRKWFLVCLVRARGPAASGAAAALALMVTGFDSR